MKKNYSSPDTGLRIVWWNTGLSPTRAPDRATESDIHTNAKLLDHLILTEQADLIVLGEVSEGACDSLMRTVIHATENHVWTKVFHPAGKSCFSFCVLSHKHRVPVSAKDAITLELGSRVFRVGYHLVLTPLDAAPIHLVVSHWPSRLFLPGSDSRRTHIAASLRTWLDAEVLSDPGAVNVVLLGDFNDEPFDEGLERYIRASRDHELVRERAALFYNPFWKHLSAGQKESIGGDSFGTYFHRSAEFS